MPCRQRQCPKFAAPPPESRLPIGIFSAWHVGTAGVLSRWTVRSPPRAEVMSSVYSRTLDHPSASYATLLLQAGAPITHVSGQLGHRDPSITLRVYAHYLPNASLREVNRLDTPQPSATPAQPDGGSADQATEAKSFGMSGEPRRNRTFNPQIKSLLLCQLR